MGYIETLMQQGAVPKGVEPKTILNPGEEAAWQPTDRLSNVLRAVQQSIQERQAEIEKQQKKAKETSDYYKTLRQAGYPSDKAHAAASQMRFPQEPGGLIEEERKKPVILSTRERILQKVADNEQLNIGEQKVYDDILNKRGTSKSKKLTEETLDTELSTGADNFGFKKGEVKEFKGKGKFEYLGKNQWRRAN